MLHPGLAEGTITRYCGSLVGTKEGGRGNILDPYEQYPHESLDTGAPRSTPTLLRTRGSQSLTPSGEDMEKHVRNLAAEFMEVATGDTFLLKHLLADFHVVRGKQQTLLAQIKHGVVEPSQEDVRFQANDDGCIMSLKRKKDFLERRR